jgi:hypothetical protein
MAPLDRWGGSGAPRQGLAQALLGQFVVAAIVEPDAVKILGVFQVAHGVEGDVDLAVAVVVVALLHLGVSTPTMVNITRR